MQFNIYTRPVCWISIFFLIALSCAPVRELPDSSASNENQSLDLERPVPYPVEIPVDYLTATEEGTRTRSGNPGEPYWQNEAEYRLTAELLPDEKRVNGTAVIRYTNNSPYDLQQILLELTQNLHKAGTMKKINTETTNGIELTQVSVQGNTIGELVLNNQYQGESGYLIDATRMLVVPGEPVTPGSTIEMEFSWTFTIPQQGASGRMGHSRENLIFVSYWYPQVSVFDDVIGWYEDPFLGNAEFYHGFADYDVEITAPDNWLILSTGEFLNPEEVLAGHILDRYIEAGTSDDVVNIVTESDLSAVTRVNENGNLTWKFSAEQVRDVAFSATTESLWDGARTPVGDRDGDGQEDYTRINSIYRASAPLWRDQAEYSQHSITFLSDYLDSPYPWPHMTSVEGADIIGGGMEYPMMTIMGSYSGFDPYDLHEVTAHEFAHMWVPMILSTNERRYSWMDEGFTTFNTHQAMMDAYPGEFSNEDVFQTYLGAAGTDYEGPMIRWSDYHYPGPGFGIASYPKPASVLTALQGILGHDLFMDAYHAFYDRWAYKHPYPWDFFRTVENVTGSNLDWFWRSWYYETWTLDQAVGNVIRDGNTTNIEIIDLGNVPMPAPLLITLEDGTILEEEVPVSRWLNGTREATVTIQSDQTVTEVVIDPETNYPDVDRSNNRWQTDE